MAVRRWRTNRALREMIEAGDKLGAAATVRFTQGRNALTES